MNLKYLFLPILLFLTILLMPNINAFQEDSCIVAWDDCVSEYNVSHPQYCHYSVDANTFTADYKQIEIDIVQGGMLNSDRDHSFIFDKLSPDLGFTVWVDKHTQPTYIMCRAIDADGGRHILDRVVLGSSSVNIEGTTLYEDLTTDDPEVLFIGVAFIIISLISMYLIAMEK